METGRATAARTEIMRPTRIASRQLSADMSKRVGAGWVAGVTDMARGYASVPSIVSQVLQGGRCAPPRASGLVQINRGRAEPSPSQQSWPPTFRMERRRPRVTSLDQARFRQQVLLELGDI